MPSGAPNKSGILFTWIRPDKNKKNIKLHNYTYFSTKRTKANLSKAREIGLSWLDFHPTGLTRVGQGMAMLATAEYNYGETAVHMEAFW